MDLNHPRFELKLFILFTLIGVIPLLLMVLTFGWLGPGNIALLAAGLLLILVIFSGYAGAKWIYRPIRLYYRGLEEIETKNRDLIRRSQEQASTLEEILASIEEVNFSIRQVYSSSDLASKMSQSTLETVKAGEQAAVDTLAAMSQISAGSCQIREIIGVVNDIASQTNLLAINAAVEAARAGEQGKGFAIVAAEIKSLAKRVTESAREVEQLIKASMERVETGNATVKASAGVLQQIIANTVRTSDAIAEVAVAIRDQAVATQQIETSINQLARLNEQNAAAFHIELKSVAAKPKTYPGKQGEKLWQEG
jgi:methyl-accepting chemotaxis protein